MAASYKGIDVSENNGKLDWTKIKAAGYDFAIIRCGYGKSYTDKQFSANVQGATKNGIAYGIYHYSYALDVASAKQEAALVLSLIKGLDLSFPVWFDMEDADGYKAKRMTINRANITAICKAFCEAIRAAGYKVGIYASKYWLETYIDTAQLGTCDFWLAQWASKPTWAGKYILWQDSDKGTISGMSGSFDTDVAWSLPGKTGVTPMEQDAIYKDGVIRYTSKATKVYKSTKLDGVVGSLKAGEAVKYYGWHCTIGGIKYAYVATTIGQGYILASELRVAKI
jgi:GH25 family lysozyme M1 (1,4-beta-N-acetylmuramidase)